MLIWCRWAVAKKVLDIVGAYLQSLVDEARSFVPSVDLISLGLSLLTVLLRIAVMGEPSSPNAVEPRD